MKKLSLLLLALFSQANVSCYSNQQVKVQGEETENIEAIVETTYKHPRAKKVGELMPQPKGKIVSYTITSAIDMTTWEMKKVGAIFGFDRDGDKETVEYGFIRRFCGDNRDLETYAVLDVPHKLLYTDSSRNNHIDAVVEGIYSLKDVWPMTPICKQEKIRT
jgi:hypothetical protein